MIEGTVCLVVLIVFGVAWLKDSTSRGPRYDPPRREVYLYYDALDHEDDRDGRDVR